MRPRTLPDLLQKPRFPHRPSDPSAPVSKLDILLGCLCNLFMTVQVLSTLLPGMLTGEVGAVPRMQRSAGKQPPRPERNNTEVVLFLKVTYEGWEESRSKEKVEP